jgi:hypothetical protein
MKPTPAMTPRDEQLRRGAQRRSGPRRSLKASIKRVDDCIHRDATTTQIFMGAFRYCTAHIVVIDAEKIDQ